MVKEVCNLVKKFPQWETKIKNLRESTKNYTSGIQSFCPTRWTLHGDTCATMLNNHVELMELWEWSLKILKDVNMKSRVIGANTYMKTFKFAFGCHLGETILRQTDNLYKTLQNKSISASEGAELARSVLQQLKRKRSIEQFDRSGKS